jgi:hypothetical protein
MSSSSPPTFFKDVLGASVASGRRYASRFSGRILPSYDEQVADTLDTKNRNPLVYRLPGEGDDAALLFGFRSALLSQDPPAAAAWEEEFRTYREKGAPPYPLGVLLRNRVNVLAPIAYGSKSREYWDHQYDFTFRIHRVKNPDEFVPDMSDEMTGGWNPVKLRQALPRTHASLFLTKIIYGNPEDPTEGSAHGMLCIFFPAEMTGDGNVLDIVSTYPLTGAEHQGFKQVVQARTLFQDRDLIALTRDEKDTLFSATKTPPTSELPPLFINDVTEQLAGRRGDPYNLQKDDPRTGHCFAWMCAIAKNLILEAPESYWAAPMQDRMEFYRKHLYPYLSERNTGSGAIEMWKDIRAFIEKGYTGGRRRRTYRKKRNVSRKSYPRASIHTVRSSAGT